MSNNVSSPKISPSKKKAKTNGLDTHSESNIVMWFRSDLRINDNRALEKAFQSLSSKNSIIGLFVMCFDEWKNHSMSKFKADFILRNLKQLQRQLQQLNIPLAIINVDKQNLVSEKVHEFCVKHKARTICFNKEYEVDERKRDEKISKYDLSVIMCDDQCIVEPGKLLTNEDKPYSVYTPFKNKWFKLVGHNPEYLRLSDSPTKVSRDNTKLFEEINNKNDFVLKEFSLDGEKAKLSKELYPEGEDEALKRLQSFVDNKIEEYHKGRDYPDRNGTSSLSMYLTTGVLSARQCVNTVRKKTSDKFGGENSGPMIWIQELVWRDFYRHVLYFFPRVCKNKPFKKEAEKIAWDDNEELFKAWCEGKTGYPIVDAAMRQLNSIGWMHNRLRMIVSMFLAKDLLINWQKGERYFMENLIDGDLASNNGGWQWVN